jgi:hypothetical protein
MLFHHDRAQLVGLPLVVLVAQDTRPAFRTQLARLRNEAEVREWVIRVQPRHRLAVPVIWQVTSAQDGKEELIGLRVIRAYLHTPPRPQAPPSSSPLTRPPSDYFPTGLCHIWRPGHAVLIGPPGSRVVA